MQDIDRFKKDIKTAFSMAIIRAGGVTHVARSLKPIFGRGCDAGWLSKYCSNDHPYFPPAHIMYAVDKFAGEPFCAQVMAAHWDMSLVPQAEISIDKPEMISRIGASCAVTGELHRVSADAVADGTLTENEKRAIRRKLAEVAAAQRHIAELTV